MTDLLAERLAALADTTDDGDWRDVRRRARPPRRTAVAAASAAAALAALGAAAVAATSGWLFTSHDRLVEATTHVAFRGREWRVAITTGGRLRVCVHVARPGGPTLAHGCGSSPSPGSGPVGARHFDVEGGQIWVGIALGFTRRITILDTEGKSHSASPVAAPRGTKTPFRFWVIGLDRGRAKTIALTDTRGRTLRIEVR